MNIEYSYDIPSNSEFTPQVERQQPQEPRPPALMRNGLPGVVQHPSPTMGLLMGAGQHVKPDNSPKYSIFVLDLDEATLPATSIEINFFGHGIVPNPARPERAAVFEKKGPGACEIDLKSGKMLRNIETSNNRRFYGHGAYAPDGKYLYCTETIVEGDYQGLIAIRDADSLEVLGEFPSHGASPHDCQLIDSGNTMVVTNGGGTLHGRAPSVTYVDVASAQLLEKIEFDTPYINAGHLARSSRGDLAVASAFREGLVGEEAIGGISIQKQGGEMVTMTEPRALLSKLYGETLSICMDEQRGVIAATTPLAGLLTFWDIETGQLIRHYQVKNPRGICLTLDGQYYVLSYGNPVEQMSLIAAETLDKVNGYDLAWFGMTGSHIFNYSLPTDLRQ
ncbi:MAG TPA: hypothetical protein DCZ03_04390 [Gammaproteobacteria bacterium]|nr:hypothetical protein [Gammaproteobacteria bacterium]